jgi:hypothetical protein
MLVTLLVAAPGTARADGPGSSRVDLMSLRLMLDKGIITQAEYDAALRDMADTSGAKGGESNTVVVGKWSATLYGFAEADYIFDSTQSYTDLAGGALVARPGTYAGEHPRSQFSIRNSRFGFLFRAPEYHRIRASAVLEGDFLGDWAGPSYTNASGDPTENQYFTSPALRLRHAYLKVETPIVDVLFGQTWHLFGWQAGYEPNTVQIQGVPGELYSRTPQLRLSKTFVSKDVTFELALGAMRPPQRDSAIPEGEGGIRLAINEWTGVQTIAATGTTVSPASIAVTGDLRSFAIPNYPTGAAATEASFTSTYTIPKTGGGVAVDAFLPVVPASREHRGNSLSLVGEFVYGQGIADLYSGLASGLGAGYLPTYNPDIDAGLVSVSNQGTVTVIQWRTVRGGLQYTIPGLEGKMWISGNYANVTSPNAPNLVTVTPATMTSAATSNASSVRDALNWFDANIMGDLTPAVRLGIEYAYSNDRYADGVAAKNHRAQGSAFFIF